MGAASVKDIVNSELAGRVRRYGWRKTPSQATTTGIWFDLSMSPGNPPPKYWFDSTPLIAKAVYQSTDGGLFHGSNVSPSQKYLRTLMAMTTTVTALPMSMILCDYLLYYPSIDEGTTDQQNLDNTVTLPRYTDGAGLQMLAITVGARTSAATFFVTYTNSEGVSDRTSQTVALNTSVVGSVATSDRIVQLSGNPFIGLQLGDSGIRSIQSVTMLGISDGLFSLLLVKPLGTSMIRGIDAPVEKDFFLSQAQLPIIQDNAYISLLCLPNGTLAATALMGDMKVCWSE